MTTEFAALTGDRPTRVAGRIVGVRAYRETHVTCEHCQRRPTAIIRGSAAGLRALCRPCAGDETTDRKIAEQRERAASLRARS